MTVTLTPQIEALVQHRIDSGEYVTAEELVADAVLQLQPDPLAGTDKAELQRMVEEGIWSAEEVIADLARVRKDLRGSEA
jgi:Arc/MetJ-type ribon-helix-helix transcriptional regulator